MDAPLRLGDRHPLNPVGPALVLHAAPHAVTFQEERDLVVTAHVGGVGAQDLVLPTHAAGVALVHLEEVLGEEVGLLASLGAADLEDDVLLVVGVLGQEQDLELVDHRAPDLAIIATRVAEHLLGLAQLIEGGPVLPVALHDRLQLLVPPGHVPQGALVPDDSGVSELGEDVLVLPLQISKPFEHGASKGTGRFVDVYRRYARVFVHKRVRVMACASRRSR